MSQTTINELELKVLDLQKQLAQITAAAVDLTILVAQMRNTAAKAPKAAPAPVVEAAAPVLPVATAPVVDVKEVAPAAAPVATPAPETAAPAAPAATADAASKRVRRSDEQVIDEVVRGVGRYPASWNAERRAAADLIVAERRAAQAAPATPAPAPETAAPESFDPPANGLFSPVVEGTPEVQPVSDTVEV